MDLMLRSQTPKSPHSYLGTCTQVPRNPTNFPILMARRCNRPSTLTLVYKCRGILLFPKTDKTRDPSPDIHTGSSRPETLDLRL